MLDDGAHHQGSREPHAERHPEVEVDGRFPLPAGGEQERHDDEQRHLEDEAGAFDEMRNAVTRVHPYDIEQTAHAIAAGDLTKRVDNDIPDTEVGRLGASLNGMLERIESGFTAQQSSERAAKESEQQMRQFVADASHELRTPLNAVLGFTELLDQDDLTPAQREATEALFRQSLEGAAAHGRLERLSLTLDGRPIAMLANFITAPGAFSYKTAYDEAYARFSPGVLLQCENLLMLDRADIAWTDSCAAQGHPMIDHIWRERRTIGRLSIAIGGAARRAKGGGTDSCT